MKIENEEERKKLADMVAVIKKMKFDQTVEVALKMGEDLVWLVKEINEAAKYLKEKDAAE